MHCRFHDMETTGFWEDYVQLRCCWNGYLAIIYPYTFIWNHRHLAMRIYCLCYSSYHVLDLHSVQKIVYSLFKAINCDSPSNESITRYKICHIKEWLNPFYWQFDKAAITLYCTQEHGTSPSHWLLHRVLMYSCFTLQWRHNGHDGVSNNQPRDCLLNRLFRRRSKKTSKLRVTGLCPGNSPVTVNSPHKWFPLDDVNMISVRDASVSITRLRTWVSCSYSRGVSNQCYFFFFFNSLARLTSTKISKPRITDPLW